MVFLLLQYRFTCEIYRGIVVSLLSVLTALFTIGNMNIRILDILDVLIALYLIYFIYKYVKGTAAVNIFIGIVIFLVLLSVVTYFKMRYLTLILSSIAGIGLIGLIVIFQPEIRRVLLVIGNRTMHGRYNFFDKYFKLSGLKSSSYIQNAVSQVMEAIMHLSRSQMGGLIIFTKSELPALINTGQRIDAQLNAELLETIFYKNTPLHDGAVIIQENRIVAASCILPVSANRDLPKELGLRHRAALGVNESHEVLAVVVSEQNGSLSYAFDGKLYHNVSEEELRIKLEKYYTD